MRRIIEALGIVLAVCVGVAIAAALVTPLIPAIAAFLFMALIVFFVFGGPRAGNRPPK